MMAASETPATYLPFAVGGFVAGVILVVGGGVLVRDYWAGGADPETTAEYITVQGRIAEAQWRRSATPDGPTRYLQVNIEGDSRGYLVAEQDVSLSTLDMFDGSEEQGSLSGLVGRKGVLRFDSTLRDQPTPYLAALRIDGRSVVSQGQGAADTAGSWGERLAALLGGVGILVGIGGMGVSVHHFTVCLRHGKQHP